MSPAADWRSLYPFESHFLDLDGHKMHYLDEGQGEPLLLVHGNPTWSFYWRELVKAFRGRHRVVVPDHVGCGLSDKPAIYPYRLARRIADLRRLVTSLDLRGVTLVAHDWGGAIGLGAAVADPERFSRLVLMNTAAFPAPRMPKRIRVCRTPLLGKLAVQGGNAFARAALWMAAERRERLTPAVCAGLLAPHDSWANRRAVYEFVQDIPMHPEHPSWRALVDVEQGLARLGHRPALLIWGMRDWCFTPWFLNRFRDCFPRAEVHELANAGHYVVEDAYERIIPLIEGFIDRSAASVAAPASQTE